MNTCGMYIDGDHEYNIISKNNFINNIKGVFFRYSLGAFNPFFNGNDISQNYWNRPQTYPKLIFGYVWAFPWFITDSDPSKTAYDI